MSINRVNISGNLTHDPEVRTSASGSAIMHFGVAVNDRAKNQRTGEWEDRPNFIDCTMFGTRAESVSRFLSKGTKVAIEGKLRWSQWDDRKTGEQRSKVEVIVDETGSTRRHDDRPQPAANHYPEPAKEVSTYAEDMPF